MSVNVNGTSYANDAGPESSVLGLVVQGCPRGDGVHR